MNKFLGRVRDCYRYCRTLVGRNVFLAFMLFAAFLNYLPDIVPYYIGAMGRGKVRVESAITKYAEPCDSNPLGEWTCAARFRVPLTIFKGQEYLGLGIILYPLGLHCASNPGEVVFIDPISEYNARSISTYLKNYRTFDLKRLNCTSDLIVENWILRPNARHGHAQSPMVVGQYEWVERVKKLVDFSVQGLLAFAAFAFLSLYLLFAALTRVTQTDLKFPPLDKFKFFWLAFVVLNGGYLFETIFPFEFPVTFQPRLSNFLGLVTIGGPGIYLLALQKGIHRNVRRIAIFLSDHPRVGALPLYVLFVAAVCHPHFRATYAPLLILFSIVAILASIPARNMMMLLFGICGVSDSLKILMIPYLPASRTTITYLLFVFGYEMITRIAILERNARFEAGTEAALEVAHDIRSPLTALNAVLPNLRGDAEQIAIANEAVIRIRGIANSLLQRVQVKRDLQTEFRCNVLELLEALITAKINEYPNAKIRLSEVKSGLKWLAHGTHSKIERALSNVINNAIEADESGTPSVEVELRLRRGRIEIQVRDRGRGISRTALKTVGNVPAYSDKSGGTGFGLYGAKRSISDIGGSISISSEIGKGTDVTVILKTAFS